MKYYCTDSPRPDRSKLSAEAAQDAAEWIAKNGPIPLVPCTFENAKGVQPFSINNNGKAVSNPKAKHIKVKQEEVNSDE